MFVQALGATGIIGFISLITYLFAQYKIAIKSFFRFRGLSVVLLVFTIVRCITETPFRTANLDESMFLNVAIFVILIYLNKKTTGETRLDIRTV